MRGAPIAGVVGSTGSIEHTPMPSLTPGQLAYQAAYREAHRDQKRAYQREYNSRIRALRPPRPRSYVFTAEHRRRLSVARKRQIFDEATRAKIGASAKLRWTPELRARIAQISRERQFDETARQDRARRMRDLWRNPDFRAAVLASASARKGVPAPPQRVIGICAYCGAPATTLDHIRPRARGGSDDPANLIPACRSCNSSKSALALDEWFITPRGARAKQRLLGNFIDVQRVTP